MGIFKKTIKYSKPSKDLDHKIKKLDEKLKQTGVIEDQNDLEVFVVQEEKELPKIYDEIEIEKKEESLYNWRETFVTEEIRETQDIIEEVEYKSVRKVESYISESNKELIEIRDQVFQEISESTLLNLPEIKYKIEKVLEIYDQIQEGLLNEPPDVENSDPLTPLDQNFVTVDDLNKHYSLFINRIQEQLATIGGGGETRLKYLDDIVGIATNPSAYNGKFLKYDHTIGKFVFTSTGGAGSQTLDDTLQLGNTSSLGMSVGVITALSFSGNATSATYATTSGVSTYSTTAGITTVAQGLAGTPNINVGVVTATSFSGNGTNLTGIVTSIVAGNNITISGSTGQVTINSTATGGGNSGYANTAGIATYATTSGIATYASTAGVATYSNTAGIATYSNASGVSTIAGYATTAGVSTYSNTAGIATYASTAGVSTVAGYASTAGIATYASTAGISTYSNTAGIATYASLAGISTYATTAGVATALQNSRTFEITGDVVASTISFDGTGNVSLAATIQPNSVGLGTDTFGDYVRDISGTSNQITVTSGTGEGSTPTLSIPNQFTVPQDIEVTRDLQVNRNLNVTGNITIGGTAATLFSQELKIFDPDIVLGFRTDAFGNDISTDNTANHGGIAIASTEGSPLVNLFIAGIETNPATYKKIMWFKSGEFAGLGTDAWLSNYAIGIGSTQFPVGTRLAAGNVQFTENDLAVVRNINASGIVTAVQFIGTASTASFATTAFNLSDAANIIAGTINSARLTGSYNIDISGNATSATYASTAGISTYSDIAGVSTYATSSGVSTNSGYASTAGIATYADIAGVSTIAGYATTAGISTLSQGLTGTPNINVGVVTATSYNGSGTNLTGIVTSIVAGTNITVSGSTGQVTINSTASSSSIDLLEVMLFS